MAESVSRATCLLIASSIALYNASKMPASNPALNAVCIISLNASRIRFGSTRRLSALIISFVPPRSALASLFAGYGSDDFSCTAVISELTEINTLPCAEIQPSVGNGNRNRRADYRRLGMGRHVIVALHGMRVVRLAFTYQAVENTFHIHPYIGVGILVDRQRRRSMLDKKIQQPQLRQLRQPAQNLIRHQMKTIRARPKRKFNLFPHNKLSFQLAVCIFQLAILIFQLAFG